MKKTINQPGAGDEPAPQIKTTMKSIFFFFLIVAMSTSCSTPGEEEITSPIVNRSFGTETHITIDIESTVPGLMIVIAPTEEQTFDFCDPLDPDCIRVIITSGYVKQFTIIRRYTPEVVRVVVDGKTVDIFKL